jgi:hypothetical protein
MTKIFLAVSAAVLCLWISGCTTEPSKDTLQAQQAEADKVSNEESDARKRYQPADPNFYKRAYQDGVRDTLREYKSRMRARETFVYEPPILQEVWIPGRVIGGTFYPGHAEKVIVAPGQWVEENAIPAPVAKQPDPLPEH